MAGILFLGLEVAVVVAVVIDECGEVGVILDELPNDEQQIQRSLETRQLLIITGLFLFCDDVIAVIYEVLFIILLLSFKVRIFGLQLL